MICSSVTLVSSLTGQYNLIELSSDLDVTNLSRYAHWNLSVYYESVIAGESINILFFVLYYFELYVKLGFKNLRMAIFHDKTFY
jgi:hypothetical protein